jgi:hypothetical protein
LNEFVHFPPTLTDERIQELKQQSGEFKFIAHDTRHIHILDVDEERDFIQRSLDEEKHPYYLSSTKKLPHLFFTMDHPPKSNKSYLAGDKKLELLTGNWCYAPVDAIVYNSDQNIAVFKDEPDSCEVEPETKSVAYYQKEIQRLVPHHSKTQVKKISDKGSIVTNGRYCENIGRAHKSNHVFFKVKDGCLIQKCTDPECEDFEGTPYPLKTDKEPNSFEEFERTHFKVMNPIGFVRLSNDGVQFLNKTELGTMYEHLEAVQQGKFRVPFVSAWLSSQTIRTYEKMDLLPPPLTTPEGIYNTWTGLPVDQMPSTGSPDLMIRHIEMLFGEKRISDYVLKWLAQIIQRPAEKTGIGMVWMSEQGTGKGMILEQLMGKILGSYFAHTPDPANDLFGRFGECRNRKLLVNIDDASIYDIKTHMERTKTLIAGERINYEAKGKQPISFLNCSNYIITTQSGCPIKLEASDRRWVVFECDNKLRNDRAHFEALGEWLKSDANVGAFYEYLKGLDIENFNFCDSRPITNAYNEVKMLSADKELLFLASVVQGSKLMFRSKDLYDSFTSWVRDAGFENFTPRNQVAFGIYVSKIGGIEKKVSNGAIYILDKPKLTKYLVSRGVQIEGVCLFD